MSDPEQFGGGSLSGNRAPSLREVIREHILDLSENLRVCQPGRIDAYDDVAQRADVIPLLRSPAHISTGKIVYQDLPKILNVPVVFPVAGQVRIKMPVTQGDIVLLIFCDFNIDDWKGGAGADDPNGRVTPRIYGSHQTADAICIPGFAIPGQARPFTSIELKADGSVIINGGATEVARNGGNVNRLTGGASFGAWMGQVESFINGVSPGALTPLLNDTIGVISDGSSKLKVP